jgi:diaminopimelate decarboxylase
LLDEISQRHRLTTRILLRVNPSFSVKGSGLTMGGKPRQFGIDEDALLANPRLLDRWPHTQVCGVQVYMGTRLLDEQVIAENTRRILALAETISGFLGFPLDVVDVGGGLGVAYFEGERDLAVPVLAKLINEAVDDFRTRRPDTRIAMELGRFLAAPAGLYVVRVRYVKSSMGERFAVTDGGTNHHMAAVGIGSFIKRNFPVTVLNRMDEDADQSWHITGPLCTPNDTLAKGTRIPEVRPGDLIGVHRSGAYGPSASPVLFLSHGYPAEVLVADGEPHLIRERDTPHDLLTKQRLAAIEYRLPNGS